MRPTPLTSRIDRYVGTRVNKCVLLRKVTHRKPIVLSKVPLTIHVIGQGKIGDSSKDRYFFWQNLDRNVPEMIARYSNNRPAIVFCHSKLDCEKLADLLAVSKNIGFRDSRSSEMAAQTRVSKLQRVLLNGIGYHHAGLEVEDRRLVERSFASGKIRVICATSTIAMGVNLPAHLVVVKGTAAWRGAGEGGGFQDIDQATLLQMVGRAGRAGFDSSGTAIIMTDNDSKPRFQHLASKGLAPVKSQMKGDRLVETINANVSQRVISSTESAINWIKGTLFFVQVMQNPEMHGIVVASHFSIDTFLLGVCKTAVERLKAIHAISLADGQEIHPLPASHIMSQRLVEYKTMEQVSMLPFDSNQRQLLRALADIEGLHRPVRRSEKKALNAAHKTLRLYKLDGPLSKARVQESWEKAFVLLQAYIEELDLESNDYTLRQEMNSIVDYGMRMLSAIEEYSANGSKHGNLVVQSIKLRRSLAVRLWSANDGVLRQIKGIGKNLAFSLHLSGIASFSDVMKTSPADIEKAADRQPPFGAQLRQACASILHSALKVSASITTPKEIDGTHMLTCSLIGDTATFESEGGKIPVSYTLIAYTASPGSCMMHKENITNATTYTEPLPQKFGKITVHLVASVIGLDGQCGFCEYTQFSQL
jgi:ATP-dependent DNA helicase HFM1/MER3